MLKETISESYKLFSNYRAIRPLDICTECCMTIENEKLIASLPVKKISRDLLAKYNDGAATEKTPINEVKHFLPRYFDLISQFEFPSHSTEISLKRLHPFNKTEWNVNELNMLKKFSIEYFEKCLSTYPLPNNEKIDSIIVMFWRGKFDINELLTKWEQIKGKESILHFRDLLFFGFANNDKTKLCNPFGEKQLSDELRNWVEKESVKQHFSFVIEELIMSGEKIMEGDLNYIEMIYKMINPKEQK